MLLKVENLESIFILSFTALLNGYDTSICYQHKWFLNRLSKPSIFIFLNVDKLMFY